MTTLKRKLISICFLDLLHRLSVEARALAWDKNLTSNDKRYLKAIVKTLEKFAEKTKVEAVWPISLKEQPAWESFLKEIFDIKNLEDEKVTEILFYYPWQVSVLEKDYEILLLVFNKTKNLIGSGDKLKAGEYMDSIHALPDALKSGFIDRKAYFRGFFSRFLNQWPDFFNPNEIKLMKEWSNIAPSHGIKGFLRKIFHI